MRGTLPSVKAGCRFAILAVAGSILFCHPAFAALSEAEMADVFSQGKELFRQANELSARDPAQAREIYRKAALRFERIAGEGGVANGKLFYNIGNAYFRMDDIGRAILNYRKAAQFIPNDPNLQQNLDYARQRRTDRVEEAERRKVLQMLVFWHYDFAVKARAGVFGGAFALLWLSAALRLLWPRPFLRWITGIAGVIAALFLGSLIAESLALKNSSPGVIVAEEVIARKGDSATYEPSFQEPLHAGTEFERLEVRGDWMHVELADARRCWLPAKAVETVR